MRSRENHFQDMVAYVELLEKVNPSSDSYDLVLDAISNSPYLVGLSEFVMVMERTFIPAMAPQRFELVKKLAELTQPHVPDITELGFLWQIVFHPEEGEVSGEGRTTITAVNTLFLEEEDRLRALENECVLVRAAAALPGGDENFMERVHALQDDVTSIAAFFNEDPDQLYADLMGDWENFSGDPEDKMPTLPISASECDCCSPQEAIENYFASKLIYWQNPSSQTWGNVVARGNHFWSSRDETELSSEYTWEEEAFTSFGIVKDPFGGVVYSIHFCIDDLLCIFEMHSERAQENLDSWDMRWQERLELLKLLEQLALKKAQAKPPAGVEHVYDPIEHKVTVQAGTPKPAINVIWEFSEIFSTESEPLITHTIKKLNSERTAYSLFSPLDFEDGFLMLKSYLNGEGFDGKEHN